MSKKKVIAFFSTTRAESGAFAPLLRELKENNLIDYKYFLGGTHLAPEYGNTINEIKSDEIKIDGTFDYLLNEDSGQSMTQSCGIAMFKLAQIFEGHHFDYICLAGDRFELVSIALTAILYNKPIIHLYGGERTEGVIDEQIRHMLTKCSHLHFTACDEYAENIIKMGEPRNRVHSVGELVIDQMAQVKKLSKKEIFTELNLDENLKTIILTYHPVTLDTHDLYLEQVKNIFQTLDKFNFQVLITAPNCEVNREQITEYIQNIVKTKKNFYFIHSLGSTRYYSLLPHCYAVMGNSSSGIIEVPYFKIPSINIGVRQKGRIIHPSVINADNDIVSISKALQLIENKEFQDEIKNMKFKLGDGSASKKIVQKMIVFSKEQYPLLKSLTFER